MGDARSRRRRLVIVAAPLVVAAAVALALLVAGMGGGGGDVPPQLNATAVDPPVPARPVTGTDALGRPVDLPREGRPMLVTFLFSRCPTTCPLIAGQLARALDEVGPAADGLDVVAVSVDPAGDTPARVRSFLKVHDLDGRMRYVVGTPAELAPLWKDWQVAAQPADQPSLSVHSARIVLVDREGREVGRYAAGLPIPPRDIAEDIRTLLEQ